ncbi:hypothetical protein BDD12DRAFT_810209 [Trichophaea hybrida]|nr:hypothetical protein BDD12DRAFT_810209 [Trichophaea hybrida]
MHAVHILHQSGQLLEQCGSSGENPSQYGLPCHHAMHSFLQQNNNIPNSLIHPHWFLDPVNADPVHQNHDPTVSTFTGAADHYLFAAGEVLLSKAFLDTEAFCAQLSSEQAEQFANRYHSMAENLWTSFNSVKHTSAKVQFAPLPKPSKRLVELQKKAHGRAMARLPTAAEYAEIESRKRKRALTLANNIPHTAPSSSAPPRLEVDFQGLETQYIDQLEALWYTKTQTCHSTKQQGRVELDAGPDVDVDADVVPEDSLLSWHDEFDSQATVLL